MTKRKHSAAMNAIFDFCEAMEGEVSIDDLLSVMRDAVKDGHEMMSVQLSMASIAAGKLVSERKA